MPRWTDENGFDWFGKVRCGSCWEIFDQAKDGGVPKHKCHDFSNKNTKPIKKVANSHSHLFKIKAWSDKPNKLSDASSPWLFSVTAACECGVTQEREPTAEEIERYIGENSCSFCHTLNTNHQSQSDCIKYLSLTVMSLEDSLDKMAEEISDIKGQSRD